ncbi:hypothetical protein [Luteolibacter soli]|uniref:DUF904 domain-containing protein n=1 Tax=Luteolibacter soli TaxID=3135280 RepID=A0ABU9ANT4_9BACT
MNSPGDDEPLFEALSKELATLTDADRIRIQEILALTTSAIASLERRVASLEERGRVDADG